MTHQRRLVGQLWVNHLYIVRPRILIDLKWFYANSNGILYLILLILIIKDEFIPVVAVDTTPGSICIDENVNDEIVPIAPPNTSKCILPVLTVDTSIVE